jgi:hypothetical protein
VWSPLASTPVQDIHQPFAPQRPCPPACNTAPRAIRHRGRHQGRHLATRVTTSRCRRTCWGGPRRDTKCGRGKGPIAVHRRHVPGNLQVGDLQHAPRRLVSAAYRHVRRRSSIGRRSGPVVLSAGGRVAGAADDPKAQTDRVFPHTIVVLTAFSDHSPIEGHASPRDILVTIRAPRILGSPAPEAPAWGWRGTCYRVTLEVSP